MEPTYNDPALPHLATALDPEAMHGVFAKVYNDVRSCAIMQVRYKPGRNCLLSYRLLFGDGAEQILAARLYEAGGSQARFVKAQAQSLIAPRFGEPLFHLPELDMVVWAFPNERKLIGLAALNEAASLPSVVAAAFGDGWQIVSSTNELAHYVAEHTCTVRVTTQLRNEQTQAEQRATFFGKTYHSEAGAHTFARMQQLAELAPREELALAHPVLYQAETKTLWQSALTGVPLAETGEDLNSYLPRAAAALASLHRTPLNDAPRVTLNDQFTRLDNVEKLVAQCRPASTPSLRKVCGKLKRLAARFDVRPTASLHGDLHLKNFFVTNDAIGLIDLDTLCLGDPLQELGSFIANLYFRALSAGKPLYEAEAQAALFARAYAARVHWPVPDEILRWHIAAALLSERAARAITRLKAERLKLLDETIALADGVLGNDKAAKPFGLFTDPARLQAALQQRLPDLAQGNLHITACRTLHAHLKEFSKESSRDKGYFAAAYELQIAHVHKGAQVPQIIYAKAFQARRSHQALKAEVNHWRLYPTQRGVPLVHLDDLNALVWTFPNDPALPTLGEVADPRRVKGHLPYAALGLAPHSVKDVSIEIVNYRPEQRCTARYTLHHSAGERVTLFGKTYADERGRAIFARMQALWHEGHGDILMPRPLAYDEATNTCWQAALDGQPLRELIQPHNARRLLAATARQLFCLHRHTGLRVPAHEPVTEQWSEAKKKAEKLSRAFPKLHNALMTLVGKLALQLPTLAPFVSVVTHGDFHLRQLLVSQSGIALFDYDEYSIGDPQADLANFCADLHGYGFDEAFVQTLTNEFIKAYAEQSDTPIAYDRLAWHLRVQLLARAYRAYLQQPPDMTQRIKKYLALAQCNTVTTLGENHA